MIFNDNFFNLERMNIIALKISHCRMSNYKKKNK